MREIVFDTETTGLKPEEGERIVEIGAVELVNRFPTGKTYHVYINPDGRQVHPEALRVHGLKDEFLADKPKFSDIADEFLAFIADATLVAHNAGFDMRFINAELKRLDVDPITDERVIDTLALARRKHPMGPNSLDALCNRYGVDNSSRDLHGALLDSELLAEVYIEMTGGRQAALVLDQKTEEQADTPTSTNITRPRRSRDKPLPSRLNAESDALHRKFIDSLGENPIWSRYLNDR